MSSVVEESHNTLQRSETPNWAWTGNPVYWNKYERAALEQLSTCGEREAEGLPADVTHLTETCLTCSEPFIREVDGQLFCSQECYCPPCSICTTDLGTTKGNNPLVYGKYLCAGCYWEVEEEWRHRRELEGNDESEEQDDGIWYEEEEVDEPTPKPSDFAPGKIYIEGSNHSDYFYSRVKVMPDMTLLEMDCNIHQDVETIRVFSTWEEWQDYCSPSRY